MTGGGFWSRAALPGGALFFLANHLVELGLVLDFAAGAGFGVDHAGRFGLANPFAGVGFDGLGC